MKICWDMLEGIILTKNGYFYKNSVTYVYSDECGECSEPYLYNKHIPTSFCSKSCAVVGKRNPHYGRCHSVEAVNKIRKASIGRFPSTETRIKLSLSRSGDKNHNWRGGIKCEQYCDAWADKEYKESIKERDGYRCLNPTCRYESKEDLNIHHINYDKKECVPNNLITLCRSCNCSANYNRDWHKSWYTAIMERRCFK